MQIIELPQDRRFSIELDARELLLIWDLINWAQRNHGLATPSAYQKLNIAEPQQLNLEKVHDAINRALFG